MLILTRLTHAGAPEIFAIGDCGTIEQEKMLAKVTDLFVEADTDKDGSLSLTEVKEFSQRIADVYPQMRIHAKNIPTLFAKHDTNSDEGKISPPPNVMLISPVQYFLWMNSKNFSKRLTKD